MASSFTVRADRYVAFVVTDLSGHVYTFVDFESEHEIKVMRTPEGEDRYVFLYGTMPYGFRVRIEALEVVKVRLPKAQENHAVA
jgi:hypothetical protein